MQPFTQLTAVAAPFDMANIDTDKIIPARFLRKLRTAEKGYDPWVFFDMRFDADGKEKPDFILNQAPWRNTGISGGSSSENGRIATTGPRASRNFLSKPCKWQGRENTCRCIRSRTPRPVPIIRPSS